MILLSGALASCDTFLTRTDEKRSATGKPYEVFVIMENKDWAGAPGDTLRSIFWEEFPMVNQYEPIYSVYQSDPANFNKLLQSFRNILVYRTGEQYTEPSMQAEYDKWAEPQMLVHVTGPSDSVLLEYMDLHRYALQGIFDIAEQDRFISRANRYVDPKIQEQILENLGVKINIPKGYNIRSEHDNFIWVSYELPLISQGIVIYKYPLSSRRTFTPEYIKEKRNEFVSLIPGPSEGSYMKTSEVMLPEVSQINLNGRIWFMSQGFWDVANDFMGGPFTSYSTVNATTREVITIDTYVFSPKYDKRNYVRQLQSIAKTATIPNDTVKSVNFGELPE